MLYAAIIMHLVQGCEFFIASISQWLYIKYMYICCGGHRGNPWGQPPPLCLLIYTSYFPAAAINTVIDPRVTLFPLTSEHAITVERGEVSLAHAQWNTTPFSLAQAMKIKGPSSDSLKIASLFQKLSLRNWFCIKM